MLRTFSRAHRSQYSSLRPSSTEVTHVSGTSSDSACWPHNAQVALTMRLILALAVPERGRGAASVGGCRPSVIQLVRLGCSVPVLPSGAAPCSVVSGESDEAGECEARACAGP